NITRESANVEPDWSNYDHPAEPHVRPRGRAVGMPVRCAGGALRYAAPAAGRAGAGDDRAAGQREWGAQVRAGYPLRLDHADLDRDARRLPRLRTRLRDRQPDAAEARHHLLAGDPFAAYPGAADGQPSGRADAV